jgi:hypothetical protein
VRLIAGGGVRLDGASVKDAAAVITNTSSVLAVGSRNFMKLTVDPALSARSDDEHPQP